MFWEKLLGMMDSIYLHKKFLKKKFRIFFKFLSPKGGPLGSKIVQKFEKISKIFFQKFFMQIDRIDHSEQLFSKHLGSKTLPRGLNGRFHFGLLENVLKFSKFGIDTGN